MKVCLIHVSARPTPVYGEIAHHLRLSGHKVWVTKLDEDGSLIWDNGNGIQMIQAGPASYPAYLPDSRVFNVLWARLRHFTFVRKLRKTIRALQPDVVQLNSSSLRYTCLVPLALPSETAFILDVRQIGDRHLPTTYGIRFRNMIRSLSRRISGRFCFDHSCYLHAAGASKGLGSHWECWGTVIPMGVHERFLDVERPDRGEIGEKDIVRFIYVGSLVRHRKLDTILLAIRSVANETGSFQFHFQGRDSSDGGFADLIEQLHLEQHVILLPPIPYDEVPQRLTEYDAAIAYVPYEPTDWSYHPTLKVIEYRAVGIPIIATDVAPNREYVRSGHNGILCDNTVEDFANAMSEFIENRRFREEMKDNAIRLRSGVEWCDVSQMYEDLYLRVLSAKENGTARRDKNKTRS